MKHKFLRNISKYLFYIKYKYFIVYKYNNEK